jgi:hypothetical protein
LKILAHIDSLACLLIESVKIRSAQTSSKGNEFTSISLRFSQASQALLYAFNLSLRAIV